jgi:excisionase family DNA binding protein
MAPALALTSGPPSKEDVELARTSGQRLAPYARREQPLALRVGDAGREETIELPARAVRLLQAILEDMASGRAIMIVPENAELTTQQAADFLNVSRPFLVQLLEQRKLPFRLVGTHRRVRFEDVLRYKENIDSERCKVLDQFAAEAQEFCDAPPKVDPRRPSMPTKLPFAPDALADVCRRHHIRRLSLFGSTLKGTARADSDVDLLVEFEPGAKPSLFDLAKIEGELSNLLAGRRVDLRTPEDLSRYFRDEVVREAEVQYEAA